MPSHTWASTSVNLEELYDRNFSAELKAIQQDLCRWDVLTISWFGRASILKMTVLPCILYKLQTVPIRLPHSFFGAYKKMCRAFLWGTKLAHIKWAKLVLPKSKGGIGLPDLQCYYWAVHMTTVVDWRIHSRYKGWVNLERLIAGSELRLIPWFSKEQVPSSLHTHHLFWATLHAFDRVCKAHALSAMACSITPNRGNPDFPPGMAATYLSKEWSYMEMLAKHFFCMDIN